LTDYIVYRSGRNLGEANIAAEMDALKEQLAAVVGRPPPPTPIRRPFAIT